MQVLSPADTQALGTIYSEYSWRFDSGRAADCASLFAPDGQFILDTRPAIVGRKALEEFFDVAASDGSGTHHFVSNIVVEGLGDGRARGSAYVLVLRTETESLRLVTMGHYNDVFVLADGQWRIQERRVIPTLPEGLAGAVLTQSQ